MTTTQHRPCSHALHSKHNSKINKEITRTITNGPVTFDTSLVSKYGPEAERNRVEERWVGGGGVHTYILHLSVEECA